MNYTIKKIACEGGNLSKNKPGKIFPYWKSNCNPSSGDDCYYPRFANTRRKRAI